MSVTSPIPRRPVAAAVAAVAAGTPPATEEKAARPAAARVEPPKPPRSYPFVAPGMLVNWYEQGLVNTPPQPAVVMAVGELSIEVAVVRPEAPPQEKLGVRYVHEKGVPDMVREESGGWDYTTWDHRLIAANPKLRQWPDEPKPDAPAE